MALTLKSIEFWTKSKTGWQSGVLTFGTKFTFVSGENTCGKTPLLKGIFYALGCNETFRSAILEKADGVRLIADLNGQPTQFEREFESDKIIVTNLVSNESVKHSSEKSVSNFIWSKLGAPEPSVTTLGGGSAPLYFSVAAPLFWKEQLSGWHLIYSTNNKFIVEQREEAIRFLLGLAPKHSFGVKAQLKKEKKSLGILNEEIADRAEIMNELKEIFGVLEEIDSNSLSSKKEVLKDRLKDSEGDFNILQSLAGDFDKAINSKRDEINDLRSIVSDRTSRSRSLRQITREVNAESETLSLNEEAADRFRDFNSICNNTTCGMFIQSKEVYGRSLLYLKDQMKDLEHNITQLEAEEVEANTRIAALTAQIRELEMQKKLKLRDSGAEGISSAIQLLTSQLVDTEMKLATAARLENQKKKLQNLLIKREGSHTRITELEDESGTKRDKSVKEALASLSTKTAEWAETLKISATGTPTFGTGFKYKFGEEEYKAFEGSERIRAVLAFHAAFLELALERGGNHPALLVLDTPKQQELKTNDLKDYFKKLRKLTVQYPQVQVVFSSSEFDFKVGPQDVMWKPNYPGEKHPMYLGVAGSELQKVAKSPESSS